MKKIKLPKGLRRRQLDWWELPPQPQRLVLIKGRSIGASTMAVEP